MKYIVLSVVLLLFCGFVLAQENNTQTFSFTPVNITGHNETDVTQCSFYLPGESCDTMRERCQTEFTQILVSANYGLQDELDKALAQAKANEWNKWITWVSVGVALILLIWKTKDILNSKQSKKEVKANGK